MEANPIAIGQLILRIMHFSECQAKRPQANIVATSTNLQLILVPEPDQKKKQELTTIKQDNSIEFWKAYVSEFFAENCTYKYDNGRPFELPVYFLPRFFKSQYDKGLRALHHLMEVPREYSIEGHTFLLSCERTKILSYYDPAVIISNGHLKVMFNSALKITSWEFEVSQTEELFSRYSLEAHIKALVKRHMISAAAPAATSHTTTSAQHPSTAPSPSLTSLSSSLSATSLASPTLPTANMTPLSLSPSLSSTTAPHDSGSHSNHNTSNENINSNNNTTHGSVNNSSSSGSSSSSTHMTRSTTINYSNIINLVHSMIQLPAAMVNEYGFQSHLMRYFEVSEVIESMEDLMAFTNFAGCSPQDGALAPYKAHQLDRGDW